MITKPKKQSRGTLIVVMIIAPMALILSCAAVAEWPAHLFGEPAEGSILELGKTFDESGESYYVDYEYTVTGQQYTKSFEEIELDWYQEQDFQGTARVRYLAFAPQVVRIEGNTSYRDGLTAFACWVDLFLVMFVMFWLGSRDVQRDVDDKRRLTAMLTGILAAIIGTVIGWVGGFALNRSSWSFIGLGVGLTAGLAAALWAWVSGRIAPFLRTNGDGA